MKMCKFKKQEPTKYWLVEFTLTSGEFLSFYVKAIDEEEAANKADYYEFIAENDDVMRNKLSTFKLMP